MKGFLQSKKIPNAETLLKEKGWDIDRFDGVVSLKEVNYTVNYQNVSVDYRKVVTRFYFKEDEICFFFKTTKSSPFLKEAHLKGTPADDWFELIEELANLIAKDLGLKKIGVYTGSKDVAFVKSKGYKKDKIRNCYLKSLTSCSHNTKPEQ